MYKTYVCLN